MKGQLLQIVQQAKADHNDWHARHLLQEYLQVRILEGLAHAGAMSSIAFMGGTALRLLYHLRRFSEDLDFALEARRDQYDFPRWVAHVLRAFRRESYEISLTLQDSGAVHKGLFRFPGLFHEMGLSPHRSEVARVKLEVDTKPPSGAILTTHRIRRHVGVRVLHHDRSSLLAGKLLAVLNRPWAKGRDFFDLAWYLEQDQWPAPNLDMLNAGLRQHGERAERLTKDSWPARVAERVRSVPWAEVAADINRFRESVADELTQGDILDLLRPGRHP